MTLYPLVHICSPVDIWLEWSDLLSVSCSKSRGQAAGTWNIDIDPRFRDLVKTLRENHVVELYRQKMTSGAPELLMTGLTGGQSVGWSKGGKGSIDWSCRVEGMDLAKVLIANQQYHQPYLGISPKAEMAKAFEDQPIFGANEYGDIARYGDPASIMKAVIRSFLFGGSGSKYWGVDWMLRTGERLEERMSISGIKRMTDDVDGTPGRDNAILWAYGIFDASGLYGATWQTLERVLARKYQRLWVESEILPSGKPGVAVKFDTLPFWSFDRPEEWNPGESPLEIDYDNGWSYQPRIDARERFNFYSCIPVGMVASNTAAYQFTQQEFTAGPYPNSGSFPFRIPIREREAAEYGEQYHGLKRCEEEVRSLAWGLEGVNKGKVEESVRRLNLRLWDHYFASHEMNKASVVIRHDGRWPRIYDSVIYTPDALQYMVETSTTTWRRGDVFSDSLQLNRGINRERFFELLDERNANYMVQG